VPQTKNYNQPRPAHCRIKYKSTKQPTLIDYKSTKQSTYIQYKSSKQPTLVGRANESPSFTIHSDQMVDKGDSDAKVADGDLIDFKSDVTYFPKTEDSKSGAGKKSKRPKVDHDKSDVIDFLTDDDWPEGQAPFQIGDRTPQVKRKLGNPNYQTVTAHLVNTETGAKIVVKGGLISEGILISVRSSIT
jgi:hypothetical protein